MYCPDTKRFLYYRPLGGAATGADRNTVCCHPVVQLLWGAHCHLQLVNTDNWSYYTLKVGACGGDRNATATRGRRLPPDPTHPNNRLPPRPTPPLPRSTS